MKITCDSCGSKYTIADDKVQGRKVKVRCKSCGNNIVVDGTHGSDEAGAEEAAGPPDANLWTVNLTDENSRDMTTEEIVAGWASGLVTEDAYVWRDGMADWKPVLEVAELKMKLVVQPAAASPHHAVDSRPEPARPAAAQVGATLPGGHGAPMAATPMAAPRAAAAPRAQDDIFGKSWGATSHADDDGGKRPTGARNENSVLFSLDALKASAPEPKPKAPQRSTEDLFSMGTMPGGGLLSANVDLLTAPALAPPPAPVVATPFAGGAQKKGSSTPLIAAIVIALGGLGGGYYFMSKGNSTDAEAKIREAQEAADQKVHDSEAALKKLETDLAKVRAEAEARGEDPAAAEKKAKDALAAATPAKEPAKTEPPKEASAGAKGPAKETPSGSTGAASSAPKEKAPPKEASAGGSKAFDVGAAKAALGAAAANAASCSQPGGPKGSGKVQVTFAPSGRVTTATIIEGPFGGTSVGGCISSTFKRARVPAYDGAPTQVAKGFRL